MDAGQARESLIFADKARHRARRDVALSWLPVLLYVAFAVVAVALPRYAGQGQFLWVVAAPVVAGLAALYAYRQGRDQGIEGRALAWVVIPFGLLTLAFALGTLAFRLGQPGIARFLPSLAVAAGYLVFAYLERNVIVATAGAVVLVASYGMVMFKGDPELSQAALVLVYLLAILAARVGQPFAKPSRP